MDDKIATSKVHPRYLESNATSHPWLFSAIAELIDNSYDARARKISINKIHLEDKICLSVIDNGNGMNKDQLFKMLSFGFCARDNGLRSSIGLYGNGFKSGSMRIGEDALVFTKTRTSAGIGFLSQSYLKAIGADCVRVPMLHYTKSNYNYHGTGDDHQENQMVILKYSPFKTEEMLIKQLTEFPTTGTQIIIYNLHRNKEYFQLDFESDPVDIRCYQNHREDEETKITYRNSLREYCSILYLTPRMIIELRGKTVKTKLLKKTLSNARKDAYSPQQGTVRGSNEIIFGFLPETELSEYCGMMLYADNRLIKPYEQVACQKQGTGVGANVIGVTQAKFLTPTQNKQDFIKDSTYINAMKCYNDKLKSYWEATKDIEEASQRINLWVQCEDERCLKWRRLPLETDMENLPDKWYCSMHPNEIDCSDEEENHEEEELVVPPKRTRVKRTSSMHEIVNKKRKYTWQTPNKSTFYKSDEETFHETSSNFLEFDQASTSSGKISRQKIDKVIESQPSIKQFLNNNKSTVKSSANSSLKKANNQQYNLRRTVSSNPRQETDVNNSNTFNNYCKNLNSSKTVDEIGQTADNSSDIVDDIIQEENNIPDTSISTEQPLIENSGISCSVDQATNQSPSTSGYISPTSKNSRSTSGYISPTSKNSSSTSGYNIIKTKNNSAAFEFKEEYISDSSSDHVETENNLTPLNGQNEGNISHTSSDFETSAVNKLENELAEVKNRLNHLLHNCKLLLAKLAPDIELTDNINVEELIEHIINTDLDE